MNLNASVESKIAHAKAVIAQIERDPRKQYESPYSGPRLSNGALSEISAQLFLIDLLRFCSGEHVNTGIRGSCHISQPEDIEYFIGCAQNYIKQKSAGMCCLLDSEIPSLQQCISSLRSRGH